jgi:hypothetical protein
MADFKSPFYGTSLLLDCIYRAGASKTKSKGAVIMYERNRNLLDCHIAGFTYYDGLDVIGQLKLGTEITLKSEPENPHDPNAVAIYFEKTKLGYVPQAKNSSISNLLYFGYGDIVEAKISCHNPEANTENQFRIVVKLKDSHRG